jgi:hypothetical protein
MVPMANNWAIGSTGAVGAAASSTSGMTLTRDDVGLYTVQFKNGSSNADVPAILYADAVLVRSDTDASDDTDAGLVQVTAFDASAGTISLACVDDAGVLREAASGTKICVFVVVKLSAVDA